METKPKRTEYEVPTTEVMLLEVGVSILNNALSNDDDKTGGTGHNLPWDDDDE